jgi:hypothetical protein
MQSIGLIVSIGPISAGEKPQMGPIHTIPFRIEVHTAAGQAVLELTQSAAVELVEQLSIYLRAHGYP